MTTATLYRQLTSVAAAAACVLLVAACGGDQESAETGSGDFPVVVHNCGSTTIKQRPERAVLIGRSATPTLAAVGALGQVAAKADVFPPELYDAATNAALNKIPTIGSTTTKGGGSVETSKEEVLTQRPDLMVGYEGSGSGISADFFKRSGIPFIYSFVADCPKPEASYRDPTFETVYETVEVYGRVFGHRDRAATAVAALRRRVASVRAAAAKGGLRGTAAAIFVTPGGGPTYAYGTRSMVDAQIRTVGLTNVFGNVDERNFEVGREQLLQRNPDYLIVLTTESLAAARKTLLAVPGAERLKAVRDDRILVITFDYTDPPTPLSVEGLGKIATAFGSR